MNVREEHFLLSDKNLIIVYIVHTLIFVYTKAIIRVLTVDYITSCMLVHKTIMKIDRWSLWKQFYAPEGILLVMERLENLGKIEKCKVKKFESNSTSLITTLALV